jgi:phosphonate transport system ATP-binding protein
VLGLLCGLAREKGVALLCSLHQPELAARYFNRIVEVRKGQTFERIERPSVAPIAATAY